MYGILTYIWLIFMVNVGKYTSPMDPMGYVYIIPARNSLATFFGGLVYGPPHFV